MQLAGPQRTLKTRARRVDTPSSSVTSMDSRYGVLLLGLAFGMSGKLRFDVFWGEISSYDHSVQIYESDEGFLDALEGFVVTGLRRGDATIVIATPAHRWHLHQRLIAQGLDLDTAVSRDQYIELDAEQTLGQFVREGWPDDELFSQCVQRLLSRARRGGRQVRAFGEMVALLWAQGHSGGTVRLEHLWHDLCRDEAFPVFCAYPRSGFNESGVDSLQEIYETHTKFVGLCH